MGCVASSELPDFPDIPYRLKNSLLSKLANGGIWQREVELNAERRKQAPRTIRLERPESSQKEPFELLLRGKFLGEGGFSTCFEYRSSQGSVALKVVPKTKLKGAKAVAIMQNELMINRQLRHPNIVAYSECFQDHRNIYLVLELCPYGTLFDVLLQRKKLTDTEIAFYVSQLLQGLAYLHSLNILHLDLKPENIFIAQDLRLKIGDFGVSKQIEPDGTCKLLGKTLLYAAPEVISKERVGFESDIWSLGVMMFVMWVGASPFDASSRQDMKKRILAVDYAFPKHLRSNSPINQLIASILQYTPQNRPSLLQIQRSSFMQSFELTRASRISSWSSRDALPVTKNNLLRGISSVSMNTTKITGV